MAELMGVRAEDRILAALPFFHVGGSFLAIATALVTGCSISCLEHFTGENALRCIERDRATVINGVPVPQRLVVHAQLLGQPADHRARVRLPVETDSAFTQLVGVLLLRCCHRDSLHGLRP
ncbi:MAG: fatty-acid--CoA ligase [Pseudonocardia sp.]|nr:fatty-acid--CoA ligase [Pseudonocardia sp.]